jgi:hypothetical protein
MNANWSTAIPVLIVAGLLSAGQATGQTIGPNRNLTKATGNQTEAAVAINPGNTNQIFVVSRNVVGGLYKARSSDGGVTWTGQLFATRNPAPAGDIPRAYGNASVAWDAFGNLFLVYLSQGSTTAPTYVTIAVSTDGGANFYAPNGTGPALILPALTPPLIGDQPTVAVGPGSAGSAGSAGSVWVTYFSSGGIWTSAASVSGLGAVGTFVSQLLPSQPISVNFGDIAVGPNGEVMVTYGPNSGASGTISTSIDPDGLGVAPFSTYATAFAVNVGGFTGIPAQPHWGIDPEAGLAFDRTNGAHRGRAYLVFTNAPYVGSTDTDIFVAHSDNQGSTWSAPVRVNDDAGTNSQFLPRMAFDQSSGVIAVTWYDARNALANETAQYFGAFSIDGGATFTRNFLVSVGTSDQARSVPALRNADYGDYTGNALAGGRLVAAWADNSNSTGDNPEGVTNFDVDASAIQVVAAIAGSVPDGSGITGTPLTVATGPAGTLSIAWSPSCHAGDLDYAIYEGSIGNFASHVPRVCTTSGATAASIAPGAGSMYYLVVPQGGSVEGSYGTRSGGIERPASAAACLARAIVSCP